MSHVVGPLRVISQDGYKVGTLLEYYIARYLNLTGFQFGKLHLKLLPS
jgi:hypothetical protein